MHIAVTELEPIKIKITHWKNRTRNGCNILTLLLFNRKKNNLGVKNYQVNFYFSLDTISYY